MKSWVLVGCAALTLACGPTSTTATALQSPSPRPGDDGRAATAELARVEDEALGWLSAADPRIAARTGVTTAREVLERIGTDAVLTEDATASIRGASLDLFAFRARAHAIGEAARALATLHGDLPEVGPLGGGVGRPRLERELLSRMIDEEQARAHDERGLGDASGDVVRGVVATWSPPALPQDVPDRDVWAAKHLLEIRESLKGARSRNGLRDLDSALYPLERLLAPLQYPRGTAALAQLRIALDEGARPQPEEESVRIARAIQVHLGLVVEPGSLRGRLERIEARLRDSAEGELRSLDDAARPGVLSRARGLLFAQGPCAPVSESRVRSVPPPPERAAVCGLLGALADETTRVAAAIALHDDVLLSLATLNESLAARAGLLSRPPDEDVDALERLARERPALALGPAFAAEILSGGEGRIAAWRALGEAPLDVVARELGSR